MNTVIFLLIIIILLVIMSNASKGNGTSTLQMYFPKDCQNGNIDVVLEVVDNNKKVITLKELRLLLGIDLKTSKYIVDNAPIVILKNISDEQVQYLQEKFGSIGVKVSFRNNLPQ